jgi:hypothetical protein
MLDIRCVEDTSRVRGQRRMHDEDGKACGIQEVGAAVDLRAVSRRVSPLGSGDQHWAVGGVQYALRHAPQ